MAFNAYAVNQSSNENKVSVDFDALNKHIVETCDLQNGETLIGYVSSIVDLGTQKIDDAQYDVDNGDEDLSIVELTDKYQEDIDNGRITKFDMAWDMDKKANVIKKFVPQKDRQAIIYSVDFPDIELDKAPFFGAESNPQPLRLYAGGEFWNKGIGKMVVARPIALKETKDDKLGWTMHPRSQLYKMALAAKIISADEPFKPSNIDKLLGKSFQFKVQVSLTAGKDGKKYLNERLSFVGGLARGQEPKEPVNQSIVQFYGDNDEKALKELRATVVNTITQAVNFDDSHIKQQLVNAGKIKEDNVPNNTNTQQNGEEEQWD